MRWKSGKPQYRGQKRTINKFLLLPKKIKDEWRWLEKVTYIEEVQSYYNPYGSDSLYWERIKWVDEENKKKNI
ncbi:hypothetical protein [Bacillus phage vB_BanS-Thrax4]|nr:hypothetical protein [Bacillus phage vB_BanS-Thrax4]